jgi:hypothetical protein
MALDLDLTADADVQQALSDWQSTYVRDWRFFATGETEQAGRRVRGLELPQPVLRKIFRTNALNWIPGLP